MISFETVYHRFHMEKDEVSYALHWYAFLNTNNVCYDNHKFRTEIETGTLSLFTPHYKALFMFYRIFLGVGENVVLPKSVL